MKSNKREQILNAMESLMCIMPSEDISVNLIAEKADIGKGSIYYYFKSKDEIIYTVVERCYKKAIREYLAVTNSKSSAIEKIKILFQSVIKKEFNDNKKNLIVTLHLHDDLLMHNKMKLAAIQELSPILNELLIEGIAEGSVKTDTPKESAEMIVAVITFFLDDTVFPKSNPSDRKAKLKIFAKVLETCLCASSGSFDFLFDDFS